MLSGQYERKTKKVRNLPLEKIITGSPPYYMRLLTFTEANTSSAPNLTKPDRSAKVVSPDFVESTGVSL